MKFYADTSFLGNLYFGGQRFSRRALEIRDRYQLRPVLSALGRLEFRLACLRQRQAAAWRLFLEEQDKYEYAPVSVAVWQRAEGLAEQKGRTAQPDALDALHVVCAVDAGCTHFLSFDARTRQRQFAHACGLKVLPERMA